MAQQFCTFALDGHLFGVPVQTVQEVLRQQETTPVPLSAPEISGLLNLRGQIVTVVDLRVKLDLPRRSLDSAVNVVVRTADGVVSLLVDEIGEVLTVPEAAFEPPPETLRGKTRTMIRGAYKLEGRLLLVLDTDELVGALAPRE